MKDTLLSFCSLFVIFFIPGCKKDTVRATTSTSIIGRWELRQSLAMTGITNYPSGNGSTYEFTGSAYSVFSGGSFIKKGSYKIISDTTVSREVGLIITPGEFTNRIIFDNDTLSNKIFYQIKNNTLILISGYFPLDSGVKMTYEKQ